MSQANKTAQDAYWRVIQARMGSLVNPTHEFLTELRAQLYQWIDEANKAEQILWKEEADAEERVALEAEEEEEENEDDARDEARRVEETDRENEIIAAEVYEISERSRLAWEVAIEGQERLGDELKGAVYAEYAERCADDYDRARREIEAGDLDAARKALERVRDCERVRGDVAFAREALEKIEVKKGV